MSANAGRKRWNAGTTDACRLVRQTASEIRTANANVSPVPIEYVAPLQTRGGFDRPPLQAWGAATSRYVTFDFSLANHTRRVEISEIEVAAFWSTCAPSRLLTDSVLSSRCSFSARMTPD